MNKRINSTKNGFVNLNVPSEEHLKTIPSLKKALNVKEVSEKKSCNSSNDEDIFAYSGHNDYSSIQR